MKIRKLLAVALTTALLCGGVNVNAYAAEVNTAETVTDVESTEESTNEDTEGEDTSLKEEGSEEQTEITETEKSTEETVESETEEETEEERVAKEQKKAAKKEEKKAAKKAEKEAAAKEAAEKAEKEAAAKAAAEKAAKEAAKPSYTKEELRLLSALIFCEAGSEPYAGKVAVGIVVMNRMESRLFPGSLKDVIYQKYQFGPARNGSLSKALAAYDAGKFTATNHKESIEAAKAALEGAKSVTYNGKAIDMKSTLYFSGRVSGAKFTIAHHQFK